MLHVLPKSLEVLYFLTILCRSCTASCFLHPSCCVCVCVCVFVCVCVCVCVYLHIQAFSHILSALLADPSPNSLPVSCSQGFETSDRSSPEAHTNTTGPCKWSVMRGCCTTGCFRSAFRVNSVEFHLIHDSSRQQYCFDNIWRCMYSFVLLMMGGGTAWNM